MSRITVSEACRAVIKRDLLLAFRHRSEIANPMLFFIIVTSMFPLAMRPDPELLRTIAPGVIWVAALLAGILSQERLFRSDYEDGSLEQLVLSPHPLSLLVLSKIAAHWLVTGLPLIVLAPLIGILFQLPAQDMPVLITTLVLGTPLLSLVGAIGTALIVGLSRGGVLLSLLVLPLYVPVLIFATGAVAAASVGLPVAGQLYILGALLVGSLTLAPLATAAALRISLS